MPHDHSRPILQAAHIWSSRVPGQRRAAHRHQNRRTHRGHIHWNARGPIGNESRYVHHPYTQNTGSIPPIRRAVSNQGHARPAPRGKREGVSHPTGMLNHSRSDGRQGKRHAKRRHIPGRSPPGMHRGVTLLAVPLRPCMERGCTTTAAIHRGQSAGSAPSLADNGPSKPPSLHHNCAIQSSRHESHAPCTARDAPAEAQHRGDESDGFVSSPAHKTQDRKP